MIVCNNCKNSLRPAMRFCSKCGARQGGERFHSPSAGFRLGGASLGHPSVITHDANRPYELVMAILYVGLHGFLAFGIGVAALMVGLADQSYRVELPLIGSTQLSGPIFIIVAIAMSFTGLQLFACCLGLWECRHWARRLAVSEFKMLLLAQAYWLFFDDVSVSVRLLYVIWIGSTIAVLVCLSDKVVRGRFK